MTLILEATDKNILLAAERLRTGELVAMPTETVYGLAADATSDAAVTKIFAAKGRPQFNPVIVHYNERDDMDAAVEFNDKAELLASVFWPGPLTLILAAQEGIRSRCSPARACRRRPCGARRILSRAR